MRWEEKGGGRAHLWSCSLLVLLLGWRSCALEWWNGDGGMEGGSDVDERGYIVVIYVFAYLLACWRGMAWRGDSREPGTATRVGRSKRKRWHLEKGAHPGRFGTPARLRGSRDSQGRADRQAGRQTAGRGSRLAVRGSRLVAACGRVERPTTTTTTAVLQYPV